MKPENRISIREVSELLRGIIYRDSRLPEKVRVSLEEVRFSDSLYRPHEIKEQIAKIKSKLPEKEAQLVEDMCRCRISASNLEHYTDDSLATTLPEFFRPHLQAIAGQHDYKAIAELLERREKLLSQEYKGLDEWGRRLPPPAPFTL